MTGTPRHTFRDVKLFVAAYEELSFTAAAERENATQSGVSQHVRKLEDRFGVRLFERASGAIVPTLAGDTYYKFCIELLRTSQAAGHALSAFKGGLEGRISVGLMPTITRLCLSEPLANLLEENPNAQVRIVEGYSADLTQRVKSGDLDFAVVPQGDHEIGLSARPFVHTPEMLVGAAGHSLGQGSIGAKALDGSELILPTRRNLRRRKIDEWLKTHDVRPARILELDSMMGTLDLVAKGRFVSILPALLMAAEVKAPSSSSPFFVVPIDKSLPDTALVSVEPGRSALPELGLAFLSRLLDRCSRALANLD